MNNIRNMFYRDIDAGIDNYIALFGNEMSNEQSDTLKIIKASITNVDNDRLIIIRNFINSELEKKIGNVSALISSNILSADFEDESDSEESTDDQEFSDSEAKNTEETSEEDTVDEEQGDSVLDKITNLIDYSNETIDLTQRAIDATSDFQIISVLVNTKLAIAEKINTFNEFISEDNEGDTDLNIINDEINNFRERLDSFSEIISGIIDKDDVLEDRNLDTSTDESEIEANDIKPENEEDEALLSADIEDENISSTEDDIPNENEDTSSEDLNFDEKAEENLGDNTIEEDYELDEISDKLGNIDDILNDLRNSVNDISPDISNTISETQDLLNEAEDQIIDNKIEAIDNENEETNSDFEDTFEDESTSDFNNNNVPAVPEKENPQPVESNIFLGADIDDELSDDDFDDSEFEDDTNFENSEFDMDDADRSLDEILNIVSDNIDELREKAEVDNPELLSSLDNLSGQIEEVKSDIDNYYNDGEEEIDESIDIEEDQDINDDFSDISEDEVSNNIDETTELLSSNFSDKLKGVSKNFIKASNEEYINNLENVAENNYSNKLENVADKSVYTKGLDNLTPDTENVFPSNNITNQVSTPDKNDTPSNNIKNEVSSPDKNALLEGYVENIDDTYVSNDPYSKDMEDLINTTKSYTNNLEDMSVDGEVKIDLENTSNNITEGEPTVDIGKIINGEISNNIKDQVTKPTDGKLITGEISNNITKGENAPEKEVVEAGYIDNLNKEFLGSKYSKNIENLKNGKYSENFKKLGSTNDPKVDIENSKNNIKNNVSKPEDSKLIDETNVATNVKYKNPYAPPGVISYEDSKLLTLDGHGKDINIKPVVSKTNIKKK